MDDIYYSLQDKLQSTDTITFVLMILVFVGLLGFWRFLTGRDDDIDKY